MLQSSPSSPVGTELIAGYLQLPAALKSAQVSLQHPLLTCWSLTEALRQRVSEDLRVQVLQQALSMPHAQELLWLGETSATPCLVREVLLLAGETRLVFARSVVPEKHVRGGLERLLSSPEQPLGEWLFAEHPVERVRLENLYATPDSSSACGRRSLLRLNELQLLVQEVFLQDVQQLRCE